MRKAKHRRMHVRRNVYANRYVKKTGVNLFAVIVIIGLAVALGFLTETKYVVYPLILGQEASFDVVLGKIGFSGDKDDDENSGTESEESNLDDSKSTDNSADIDNDSGANIAIPTTEAGISGQEAEGSTGEQPLTSGYMIQFGSFSSADAAGKLLNELKNSGIDASVIQKDGLFKVVGQIFADKESALGSKASIDALTGAKYSDAFVTSF